MSADAPASVPDPAPAHLADDVAPPSAPKRRWLRGAAAPRSGGPRGVVPRGWAPPKLLLPIVGGVLAVALVAGLLVWQPWSPRPVAPVSLTATSPTAATVRLSWPAAHGGATPDHYVILRDGAQFAEVPGDQTSWTNAGLKPGEKFRYEVATRGGGWQSGPSPAATVTTLAPSPEGLKAATTYSTVTLTWKPSALGPAPDNYVVYNSGSLEATLGGATTSYVARGLSEGAPFQYTVVAAWGTVRSKPSATDSGTLREAPLSALQDVTVTPTSIPSNATGATVGRAFPTSWDFTPQCATYSCTMSVNVVVPGPEEGGFPMTIKVSPSGAGYAGSTQVKFAVCSGTPTTDTVRLTLVPDKSQISNGHWGHWTGTVVATAPYLDMGNGYYCPQASWNFTVSSGSVGNDDTGTTV
jgi:hypothetical protein